jgi:chemotaxis signal transduction protein
LNKSIIFSIDEILFGIPLEKIKRIGKVRKIEPIKNASPLIHGIILYRNNPLPYITLWNFLIINPPEKEVFLIPRNFEYCALGISGIKGIYDLKINKKDTSTIFDVNYLLGFGEFQNQVVLFIDIENLLSNEQKQILKDFSRNNEKK